MHTTFLHYILYPNFRLFLHGKSKPLSQEILTRGGDLIKFHTC